MLSSSIKVHSMVVVQIYQSGNNVVIDGGGTLNTNSLQPLYHNWLHLENISGFQYPQVVFNAGRKFYRERWYGNISGPDIGDFGSGGFSYHLPNVFSGDYFGIAENVSNSTGTKILIPHSYVSGSYLTAGYIFYNKTLADFGLTGNEPALTWSWGEGSDADSFVLEVVPETVPEPSTYAILLGGTVLGYAFWRKRQ